MHLAPPSPPCHSTPLWPQVVILEFLDTFSSSSRRWRHQFLLSVSLLLPDFRRAGCVAARTGVGVTCPSARRALFCVDSAVYLVKLLSRQAHTGLIHTLGCRGQATRPRQALYVHTVERPAPLTRRHTTLTPGSIADCSTRIFRQVQAPIRQRDCSAHPPRRPPCTLLCARWTSECTKLRRRGRDEEHSGLARRDGSSAPCSGGARNLNAHRAGLAPSSPGRHRKDDDFTPTFGGSAKHSERPQPQRERARNATAL